MMTSPIFSGSYSPEDVQFLLTPLSVPDTPVAIKETLIQSGQKHYSQLLSHESLPAPAYLDLFYQAMAANKHSVAEHILVLAEQIVATRPHGITLVSLLRAGTPIGVLLKRVLKQYFANDVAHYAISIIRDIGLDTQALRHIAKWHTPETWVFIDGWTGKGVIAKQLADSLQAFASSDGLSIPAELYVLADLSGAATVAVTSDDYLLPSCILNATVSGLVSRSIYDHNLLTPTDFHGCVYYEQFKAQDLSNYFIDEIMICVDKLWQSPSRRFLPHRDRLALQNVSQKLLRLLSERYQMSHTHYIKPGIAEATRVLLRREARLLLLQDLAATETLHLRWLAESKAIPITVCHELPYRAVALIKEL